MGYTHYMTQTAPLTSEFVADVRKIIDTSNVPVASWNGTGEPLVTVEGIALNGRDASAEGGQDDSYESLILPASSNVSSNWGFCKTSVMPYDEVVTAILIAGHVRGLVAIESDGTYEDWAEGIALYTWAVGPLTAGQDASLRRALTR